MSSTLAVLVSQNFFASTATQLQRCIYSKYTLQTALNSLLNEAGDGLKTGSTMQILQSNANHVQI